MSENGAESSRVGIQLLGSLTFSTADPDTTPLREALAPPRIQAAQQKAAINEALRAPDLPGALVQLLFGGAKLKMNYGKSNEDDEDLTIPSKLDKRERSRGISIGYFDKKILRDLTLGVDDDSLWNVAFFDAVTLDLSVGRKRARGIELDDTETMLIRGDVRDQSTFSYSLKYTLDLEKLACAVAKRGKHFCRR